MVRLKKKSHCSVSLLDAKKERYGFNARLLLLVYPYLPIKIASFCDVRQKYM